MDMDIIAHVNALIEKGTTFCLVTVVASSLEPVSAGQKSIIVADGTITGSFGFDRIDQYVCSQALMYMSQKKSGIDRFEKHGATIVNLLNREYCMKLIVLVPGQKHPEQHHKEKVETFRVLFGDVVLEIEGTQKVSHPGDIVPIEKGVKHSFSSETGAVIEEISTTYSQDDSYYTDTTIMDNTKRKTLITIWVDV